MTRSHISPAAGTHVRAVLAAPRGQRFSRARRYTELRPPTPPDRPAGMRAPAPPPGERGALPAWLTRFQDELAPPACGPSPIRKKGSPLPSDAPGRTRRPRRPRRHGPVPLPESRVRGRRGEASFRSGIESTRLECTLLGMMLLAYALGLIG